jgi:predicted nucleic-acid-binding protein
MPALDTNVLVRYVVRDDGPQLAAVRKLIQQCVDAGQTLFVPVTVMLELEWVLRSSYGCAKDEVIQVVASLFSAAELRFESEQALEVALQLYREGAADFADCVHVALAIGAAEQPLFTFDKRAAAIDGARLLSGARAA